MSGTTLGASRCECAHLHDIWARPEVLNTIAIPLAHGAVTQVVSEEQVNPEVARVASRLRPEYVVAVTGVVRMRLDPNPRLPTGSLEVVASNIMVLNTMTRPLPFPITDPTDAASTHAAATPAAARHASAGGGVKEETRLRHRVLDLRRPAMAANLRARHAMMAALRRSLEGEGGFVEVETPVLTASTPEGARDYLVPSRTARGHWYALPQSPQVFKQMLMVAGVDRYYQVCVWGGPITHGPCTSWQALWPREQNGCMAP